MGTDQISRGDPVTAIPPDRTEHSRTPGYVGERRGVVSEAYGRHVLPSSVVRGDAPPIVESLYSVRFEAEELFGEGDHRVHVDLYESALRSNRGG